MLDEFGEWIIDFGDRGYVARYRISEGLSSVQPPSKTPNRFLELVKQFPRAFLTYEARLWNACNYASAPN
jgi:hypothetical protein